MCVSVECVCACVCGRVNDTVMSVRIPRRYHRNGVIVVLLLNTGIPIIRVVLLLDVGIKNIHVVLLLDM